MIELVAADIGGTHARFALAQIAGDGAIRLARPHILATSDYSGLPQAFAAFCATLERPWPRRAAIALAAPVDQASLVPVRLTNNRWVIHPEDLALSLGLDRALLLNDFAAVAHAVMHAGPGALQPVCGPAAPLPPAGTISVIGPGTGLGVAQIHREAGGYVVQPTEGGHIGFAPCDALEAAILARLRAQHGRVSAERVASGPGIVAIYEALCEAAGAAPALLEDRAIWQAALAGGDPLACAALERFCLCLGRIAGDLALAHGARAVVLAGGLGHRLRAMLGQSAFATGFCDKGRYGPRMADLPVQILTLAEPGLMGAAAALAHQGGEQR